MKFGAQGFIAFACPKGLEDTFRLLRAALNPRDR